MNRRIDTLNEYPHRLSCYKLLKNVAAYFLKQLQDLPEHLSRSGSAFYIVYFRCQPYFLTFFLAKKEAYALWFLSGLQPPQNVERIIDSY